MCTWLERWGPDSSSIDMYVYMMIAVKFHCLILFQIGDGWCLNFVVLSIRSWLVFYWAITSIVSSGMHWWWMMACFWYAFHQILDCFSADLSPVLLSKLFDFVLALLKGSRQCGLEGGWIGLHTEFKLFLRKQCQTSEPPRLFSEPPNEAAPENKLRTSDSC
jgi:hypothetical protein